MNRRTRTIRVRIDQLLVERELAESRHQAQALVLAGQVLVNGQKVEKSGHRVDREAEVRVLKTLPYVSRGGLKLEAALDHFGIPVKDRVCVDFGASTGGFSDCLLQRGARTVTAFDVGRGQLAWKLQSDPRLTIRDGFNVRHVSNEDLPPEVSLVVVDLSFISLTKVIAPLLEALRSLFQRDGPRLVHLVLLVKPQFEVGKGEVGKGGIVRDPAKHASVLKSVSDHAARIGCTVVGAIPSPILGAKGNTEFFLYAQVPPELSSGS